MFPVTFREGVLLLAILAAMLLGASVKHWRETRRERPAPVQAGPVATPR